MALSRNQLIVLHAIREGGARAQTAYDLLARVAPLGLRGPQTVYRALDSLRAAGLVHRIASLNAFVPCSHAHDDDHLAQHHHRPCFAVCRDCGAVSELDDPALGAVLGVVGRGSGYAVAEQVVELVGRCPACLEADQTEVMVSQQA
ncbi:MAG: transcriptional repressor [Roseococcus sp.]|nr:transcriptional repressor [Roseococcus sp.]